MNSGDLKIENLENLGDLRVRLNVPWDRLDLQLTVKDRLNSSESRWIQAISGYIQTYPEITWIFKIFYLKIAWIHLNPGDLHILKIQAILRYKKTQAILRYQKSRRSLKHTLRSPVFSYESISRINVLNSYLSLSMLTSFCNFHRCFFTLSSNGWWMLLLRLESSLGLWP